MKELDVFRYLKKYRTVIAILSLIAGAVFLLFAQYRIQQYTAMAAIQYTGANASKGKTQDGKTIDTSEIYSTNIIAQTMKSLGMDYTEATVDDIRMSIQVEPIVTEEDELLQKSKIENGEEDYQVFPTQYMVSFSSDAGKGKEYPRRILNQLLQEYTVYYGETYVNTSYAANPVDDVASKNYDYLEMAEVMDNTVEGILSRLSARNSWNSGFRSSRTGYSFWDLYEEFAFVREVEIRQLFSQILSGKVTKDRDLLLAKYENRNNDLKISNNAVSFEIERLQQIIESYSDVLGKIESEYDTEDESNDDLRNYVLPDVYDDWHQEGEDGAWIPVDRTAEYDVLLRKYIDDRELFEYNLIDDEYNDYILATFAKAPAVSSEKDQQAVLEEIERLAAKITVLQEAFYETNDEYNEFLGSQNIAILSSVRISERFPVMVFAVLVVIVFGVLGCVGATLLGRMEDFVEYYAFTNRVDGLPNRAKCDQYIAQKERRHVEGNFACIALRIANLQEENARLGREGGNRMLKEFADLLKSTFLPSGKTFVGNNGAGQYLVFTEALEKGQVEAAMAQIGAMLEQKSQDGSYHVELRYGFAMAEEVNSFRIRDVLSAAMTRLNAVRSVKAEGEGQA